MSAQVYAALAMAEPNYPERLKRIFIVNAPRFFATVFRVVEPWLAAGSTAKIDVFNDAGLDALLTHMPRETIPEDLGGDASTAHVPGGGAVSDLGVVSFPASADTLSFGRSRSARSRRRRRRR